MGRVYAGVTNDRLEELPEDYHTHFLHCIDYIRQGIMCSADVALEPHSPADEDLGAKDGGWNGLHGKFPCKACRARVRPDNLTVCKDYSQVIEYLDGEYM